MSRFYCTRYVYIYRSLFLFRIIPLSLLPCLTIRLLLCRARGREGTITKMGGRDCSSSSSSSSRTTTTATTRKEGRGDAMQHWTPGMGNQEMSVCLTHSSSPLPIFLPSLPPSLPPLDGCKVAPNSSKPRGRIMKSLGDGHIPDKHRTAHGYF